MRKTSNRDEYRLQCFASQSTHTGNNKRFQSSIDLVLEIDCFSMKKRLIRGIFSPKSLLFKQ